MTSEDLINLCTDTCNSSIATFRGNVLDACADDVYTDTPVNATGYVYGTATLNDIYNVQGMSVMPIALADYYFLNWKLNCMQDEYVLTAIVKQLKLTITLFFSSTPPNYCYELTGNNTTNGTSKNLCGKCDLGAYEAQLEDGRTYDAGLAEEYSSLVSSCGITAAPLTTPTPVFLADPK